MPELTSMIGKLKEQMFQLSAIMQELIKIRNENEEAPMNETIKRMSNKILQSLEQMDKTLRETTKEKKERPVDQINESNKTARKVTENKK